VNLSEIFFVTNSKSFCKCGFCFITSELCYFFSASTVDLSSAGMGILTPSAIDFKILELETYLPSRSIYSI
jgi:hypothetical protein